MKFAIIVLMAMVAAAMADCNTRKTRDAFDAFRRQYRKVYANQEEENYRCTVFGQALERIESHNMRQARGEETYTKGINEYSDLTTEEFLSQHTGLRPELEDRSRGYPSYRSLRRFDPNLKIPDTVDWNADGFVTPVRNQGKCGSCYSFASIANIESRKLIKDNKPNEHLDKSEQHVVDCSGAYGNQMCMGGLMTNTWNFLIKENHGTMPETNYPYISSDGQNGTKCSYDNTYSDIRLTGYVEVKSGDEDALRQACSEGPVAVGIDADGMQDYASGIYCPKTLGLPKCSRIFLNHAVLLTGYSVKGGYWHIKNSWGESWGENGYIRMCSSISNMCGIARMASYPLVA